RENFPDQSLAGGVVGMSLAAEDELEGTRRSYQGSQGIAVGEDHCGPLVGCGATSEADGKNVAGQLGMRPMVDFVDKLALCLGMGRHEALEGDASGVVEVIVVLAPAGHERVEEFRHLGRYPCLRVDAVRDRMDRLVGIHRL